MTRQLPRFACVTLAVIFVVGCGQATKQRVGTSPSARAAGADPPVLVRWKTVGDISLGESRSRVQTEYGTDGHGFHVVARYGDASTGISIDGYYRLHGYVAVTFNNDHVDRIAFGSPYYRTSDNFGVGSRIPLGPCHKTAINRCEHRWHGFIWDAFNKDQVCDCWVKVGDAANSQVASVHNFLKPWYYIYTKRGRVTDFVFDSKFID